MRLCKYSLVDTFRYLNIKIHPPQDIHRYDNRSVSLSRHKGGKSRGKKNTEKYLVFCSVLHLKGSLIDTISFWEIGLKNTQRQKWVLENVDNLQKVSGAEDWKCQE